ncbi:hypothetical protein ACI2KR_07425 [Pseudomonas luteola]
MNKIIKTGMLMLALCFSTKEAMAKDVYLEGKIINVVKDGTLWIEISPKFHETYSSFADTVFQNYKYKGFDVFQFQLNGISLGIPSEIEGDPHQQAFQRGITLMKQNLTGRQAKILCVDTIPDLFIPSCISEIDGRDVAVENLKAGHALIHTTKKTPKEYIKTLQAAQDYAETNNMGLWSSMAGLFSKSL